LTCFHEINKQTNKLNKEMCGTYLRYRFQVYHVTETDVERIWEAGFGELDLPTVHLHPEFSFPNVFTSILTL
jgi:hypothetical protein